MSEAEELQQGEGEVQGAVETPAPEAASPAPSSDAAPAQPQAPAAPPTPPQDHLAPVKALLDERDRRQAAEREAAQLKAWRAEQERKAREAAAQAPNVLDDPEGYHAYWQNRYNALERGFQQRLEQTAFTNKMNLLRRVWSKDLGGREKLVELEKWAAQQPPDWLDWCNNQEDPFEAAYEAREQRTRAEKAKALEAELGGKSLEERIAEAVAAERAKWESAHADPETPGQPRAPDGKFASPSTRHQPMPLSQVNGAAAPRGGETRSGYDAAFRRG